MSPELREAIRRDLIQDEAVQLKPYVDTVGKLSIGVGRNLTDRGLSLPEVLVLLDHDLNLAFEDLHVLWPGWTLLSETRQRVLVNMMFNLGRARFQTFVKFWAALQRGNYTQAAEEMLDSKWAQQVGIRAERLAEMMRTDQ